MPKLKLISYNQKLPKIFKKVKKISKRNHKLLVLQACEQAEHVLPLFEKKHPKDKRPGQAIKAGRAWSQGKITVGEARKAALVSHAAARTCQDDAAKFAARAAGHAAATAHVPGHAPHIAIYAIKAEKAVFSLVKLIN